MAQAKKTPQNKQTKMPVITEQRLLIVLICILLVGVGYLLFRSYNSQNISTPLVNEQKLD